MPLNSFRKKTKLGQTVRAFVLALTTLTLCSCSMYQVHVRKARQLMADRKFTESAAELKERAFKPSDDQLIYLFDYALAQQYAGEYRESNRALHLADELSEVKDYHSISRITGSLLFSESLVQYKGDAFEKVLVNAFSAINYLMLGNLESALVEARRLNLKLQKYKEEANKDFEQNVFARYIAAIAWEADRKYDDAYIDYAEAYRLNPSIPQLHADLIIAAKAAQRPEELKKWQGQFPEKANLAQRELLARRKDVGELVLIYQQGWGPIKRPNPAWFRVPKLYPRNHFTKAAEIHLMKDGVPTETVARTSDVFNITEVAVKTLDDEYAALIAKRVAARMAKHAVANEVYKKNKGLGQLLSIAMNVTDQADLRQWSTLPNSLNIARTLLPVGTHTVRIQGLTARGSLSGEYEDVAVEIKPGQKTFLNWRSFL